MSLSPIEPWPDVVELRCNATTGFPQWDLSVHRRSTGEKLFEYTGGRDTSVCLIGAVHHLVSRIEQLEKEVWKYEYAGTEGE